MSVMYGSMYRHFKPNHPDNIFIAPDYKHRSMGENLFWKRQDPKRIVKKTGKEWPTGYPPGHFRLLEE